MKKNTKIALFIVAIFICCMIYIVDELSNSDVEEKNNIFKKENVSESSNTFKIISSSENEDLENLLEYLKFLESIKVDTKSSQKS